MFREMLQAKDQVVMNLTNQLFELEHKSPDEKTHGLEFVLSLVYLYVCLSPGLTGWLLDCWPRGHLLV